MSFQLPPLPFAPDALEPFMSAETLAFHHGKHHRAYVDKANALAAEAGLESRGLVELIEAAAPRDDRRLFNNAAQVWNHSFFWQGLAPSGTSAPSGQLKARIEADFGSHQGLLDALAKECTEHFASGWGWLVLEGERLKVTSLHDADTPVAHGLTPLFTLDVWEHAYYVDYRNDRPRFVRAVLEHLVNWDFVAANLDGEGASRADQKAPETVS